MYVDIMKKMYKIFLGLLITTHTHCFFKKSKELVQNANNTAYECTQKAKNIGGYMAQKFHNVVQKAKNTGGRTAQKVCDLTCNTANTAYEYAQKAKNIGGRAAQTVHDMTKNTTNAGIKTLQNKWNNSQKKMRDLLKGNEEKTIQQAKTILDYVTEIQGDSTIQNADKTLKIIQKITEPLFLSEKDQINLAPKNNDIVEQLNNIAAGNQEKNLQLFNVIQILQMIEDAIHPNRLRQVWTGTKNTITKRIPDLLTKIKKTVKASTNRFQTTTHSPSAPIVNTPTTTTPINITPAAHSTKKGKEGESVKAQKTQSTQDHNTTNKQGLIGAAIILTAFIALGIYSIKKPKKTQI